MELSACGDAIGLKTSSMCRLRRYGKGQISGMQQELGVDRGKERKNDYRVRKDDSMEIRWEK